MKVTRFYLLILLIFLRACFVSAYAQTEQSDFSSDIPSVFADDFSENLEFLTKSNIISQDFNPDEFVSRAEFLKMTVLSLDKNIGFFGTSFSDISSGDPYYSYISFAEKEKIITGAQSGAEKRFLPDNLITRQDAAVMLARAYHADERRSFNISKFRDGIYISDYALSAMAYMSGEKIMNGDERGIRPLDNLTGAEAVRMIYRIMQKTGREKEEDIETDFTDGYPMLRADGISGGFNLTVKTTSECNIYYTLSEKEYSVFNKIIPENFLISITEGNAETDVYIPAAENKIYTIYLCTVDKHGKRGKIISIKNSLPHPYTTGSGTQEDPYIISTENQLYSVRYFPDKAFRLKNNIELSGKWESIGNEKEPFCGNFDGGGFCISNLSCETEDLAGLFGYIKGGYVKNLYVSADKITASERAGIIAGEIYDTVIDGCLTDGIVEAKDKNGGGIAGVNGGKISNSQSAAAAVRSGNYAGGICGSNTGVIEKCMSVSYLVQADMYASGIAGINEGGSISSSCAVNMNIVDDMAKNSGRITTNRRGGTLENNYSYDLAYSSNDADSNAINGEYTPIEDLIDPDFYKTRLDWEFDDYWRGGDELFIIPTLKAFPKPDIEQGLTVYAPIPIYTKEDFLNIQNDPSAHYAVMNNIELGKTLPLCGDSEKGFCGSIDGRGFSVSPVRIEYDDKIGVYGLFGYVTGGIIKNIVIENMYVSGNDITGGFAGVNYGTLSNITIKNANIRANQVNGDNVTVSAGAAVNYGTVKDFKISADISVRGNNITAGNTVGYNEGTVSHSSASGSINVSGYEDSSSTAGGICGFNNFLLSELFADVDIKSNSKTAYLGGIAGMSDGGEIYKTSSMGDLTYSRGSGLVYSGGIFALGSGIKLCHCHSGGDIKIYAENIYAGGIGGYNLKSNLQCSYSISKLSINAEKEGFAGGIAGINENGFIYSNIGAAEIETKNNSGRIAGYTLSGTAAGNYGLFNKEDKSEINIERDGINIDKKEMSKGSFYFEPVSEGGKLGWENIYSGSGVWKWGGDINPSYLYPLLENVPGEEHFAF